LLGCRWVVARGFGCLNRFRRLARDYERCSQPSPALTFLVLAMLMLVHTVPSIRSG
ncbi:IS5/IS1182 family transposase, partial [Paraburkholderia sp. SIMBA_050]